MPYYNQVAGVSTVRDHGPYSHPLSTIITGIIFTTLGCVCTVLAILLVIFYVFCRKERYCVPLVAPIVLGSFGPSLLLAGIIFCISGAKHFSRVRNMMKMSQTNHSKIECNDDTGSSRTNSMGSQSRTSTTIEPMSVNENICKQIDNESNNSTSLVVAAQPSVSTIAQEIQPIADDKV